MIPRGRPTLTLSQVATRLGLSLSTFKRNHRAVFTSQITPVDDAQPYQYDEAQVAVYLEALRAADMDPQAVRELLVPELPTEPHSDDLLTDREAGRVLGVEPSTVRQYGAAGILPGVMVNGGRRWRRGDVEAHRQRPERRHRTRGSRNKTPRADRDPRAAEVAVWLLAADRGERSPVTTEEIRTTYEVPDYTARRILARARQRN